MIPSSIAGWGVGLLDKHGLQSRVGLDAVAKRSDYPVMRTASCCSRAGRRPTAVTTNNKSDFTNEAVNRMPHALSHEVLLRRVVGGLSPCNEAMMISERLGLWKIDICRVAV